ncbi:hypothetical protein HDU96_001127 [Phlyctochytrium bullatum]|nr:hypothetical protein HDU96_001127 [Phlyctochytrium bullatum]
MAVYSVAPPERTERAANKQNLYTAIADLKNNLSLDDESRQLEILQLQNSDGTMKKHFEKKVKNAADLMKDQTKIKSRVVFNEPSARELTEENEPKEEEPVAWWTPSGVR